MNDQHPLRKSKLTSFAITAFFLIVTVLTVLIFLAFCRVKTVNIENCVFSDKQTVMKAGKINVGMHIYALDKEKVEERIKEANPYVCDVYITRTGMTTLNITLTEDAPGFYIEQDGKYIVLSETLRVLEICNSKAEFPTSSVAQISLPPVETAVLKKTLEFKEDWVSYGKECIEILEAIAASGLSGTLTYADISEKFDLRVTYKDKYDIRFGSPYKLSEKLSLAVETIEYLEDPINRLSTAKGIIHASVIGETSFEATGAIGEETQ
mgnify:CR=1 FL=1